MFSPTKPLSNSSALLEAVCAPAGMLCPILNTQGWYGAIGKKTGRQQLSGFIKHTYKEKLKELCLD